MARFQLRRPFCAIDVTATCESSKLDTPGQNRLAAPFHASVADTERHLFCKQVGCGCKTHRRPQFDQDAFHGVIAALLFVKETEPGRNRLGSPISTSCARRRSRAGGSQVHLTRCDRHAAIATTWCGKRHSAETESIRGARPLCFRGVRVMHTAVRAERRSSIGCNWLLAGSCWHEFGVIDVVQAGLIWSTQEP